MTIMRCIIIVVMEIITELFGVITQRKKQLTLSYIQQVKAANEERRKRQQQTQSWNFQVYPNLYSSTQKVDVK